MVRLFDVKIQIDTMLSIFTYLGIAQYYRVPHSVVKSSLKLAVVRLSIVGHPKLYETKSLSSLVLMNTDIWKRSKNYT